MAPDNNIWTWFSLSSFDISNQSKVALSFSETCQYNLFPVVIQKCWDSSSVYKSHFSYVCGLIPSWSGLGNQRQCGPLFLPSSYMFCSYLYFSSLCAFRGFCWWGFDPVLHLKTLHSLFRDPNILTNIENLFCQILLCLAYRHIACRNISCHRFIKEFYNSSFSFKF